MKMKTAKIVRWIVFFILGSVFTVQAGTAAAADATAVNYRLKWLFNVSVIGDIYADVHGMFAAKGLNVTVKEGGPERDAIKEIELGQAAFGVASADQVIRARAKGSPVVVLAQLFQINPLQWIYRPDTLTIGKLSDLKDRILGVTFGGNDETILRTLLAKADLTEGDVRLFSVRYDYTPFYQRKVDIWPVYRNAQGVILKDKLGKSNEAVAFFNPADYGVKFVANSVVTSEKLAVSDPDLVRRFVTALMAGWTAALSPENREKALSTLAQYDKDTPRPIVEAQYDATVSMIRPTPEFAVGTIDTDGWKQTERIMLEQGQISKLIHVEKVLRSEFLSLK